MTVEEGNLLIAKFMNVDRWEADVREWGSYWLDGETFEEALADFESFRHQFPEGVEVEIKREYCRFYHVDWNKLMEVVEKIESIDHEIYGGFEINIRNKSCTINVTIWPEDEKKKDVWPVYFDYKEQADSKIEATWEVVVRFIKKYNEDVK